MIEMEAYEDAIGTYDLLIQQTPNDDFAHYNRGVAFLYAGYPERALKDFQMALQLNPSDFDYTLAKEMHI